MPNYGPPGSPANYVPRGAEWLGKALKDLQRQIDELKTAIPYGMASRNFDGTLDPPAAGTRGWGLTAAGDAIFNDLILRGDIIGNDALANPVYPVAAGGSAGNFAIDSTPHSSKCEVDVAVPDGYTQVLVQTSVDLTVFNSSGGGLYVYANAHPGSAAPGVNSECYVPNSEGRSFSNSAQNLLTGLSGGSIAIKGEAYTSSGTVPASAFTWINVSAILLFLR